MPRVKSNRERRDLSQRYLLFRTPFGGVIKKGESTRPGHKAAAILPTKNAEDAVVFIPDRRRWSPRAGGSVGTKGYYYGSSKDAYVSYGSRYEGLGTRRFAGKIRNLKNRARKRAREDRK